MRTSGHGREQNTEKALPKGLRVPFLSRTIFPAHAVVDGGWWGTGGGGGTGHGRGRGTRRARDASQPGPVFPCGRLGHGTADGTAGVHGSTCARARAAPRAARGSAPPRGETEPENLQQSFHREHRISWWRVRAVSLACNHLVPAQGEEGREARDSPRTGVRSV
jgi:hypothetical protein